jgi:hypothetical protein
MLGVLYLRRIMLSRVFRYCMLKFDVFLFRELQFTYERLVLVPQRFVVEFYFFELDVEFFILLWISVDVFLSLLQLILQVLYLGILQTGISKEPSIIGQELRIFNSIILQIFCSRVLLVIVNRILVGYASR